jgi:class 3 adenylate cyclase/CheY-like chemotaxis protein
LRVGGQESDFRTLEAALQSAGISDVKFVAPAEAIEIVGARGADLMLVDVVQGASDILQLLQAAAAAGGSNGNGAAMRVPVIVTGPAAAADRLQACLQRGAEDYLTTPLDPKNPLLATRRIALALQRRQLSALKGKLQSANGNGASDPNETSVISFEQDILTRFVPKEFLEHLERKSLADVKLGDHVQRDMIVFFSDIRDFTTLSEAMSPQDNFNFLNSYLKHVNPIIRARGGFIDKYIGDAIMALFPQSAKEALQAALDLQVQVAKYNQGRRLAGYLTIKIGIGMHRGELILGTIGEGERMQTTVISDAVNVASRIEGLTKTLGAPLLISGTVVEGLDGPARENFKLRNLGNIKAKGKTQAVELYEVYNNDPAELIEHKDKWMEAFTAGMEEFKKGMFLTAGRIFQKIAELNTDDIPAAYFRDRCTLDVVRERGPGAWDGAEKIEVK